ncbi:MAG: Response regulator [Candidatus Amesbacteria bacterium GW2011_GWC1_47_15]|uniref:Response regulator n=1 Tax=Candidatus Amesbacteria bacterium GW2011_GWC1_47_15 TaxID=1618364 RepID=A0A0G1S3Z7_9BACT|nr:MAG: Response regulator [Candidatus Amesbacteria bacterium GW2011_GWC1_47_15]
MKKILLIIEDDLVLARMYQTLLQNHGFDAKTAADGEAGLKAALKIHPDLILLDIRMPKMDGMTVMHNLREDKWGKTAPIIILTNLDLTDERLTRVVKDQPSYYLIKANNSPEQVLEKVTEILT